MNTEDKKIWQFIQDNDFVAKHLFFYDRNNNDLHNQGIFFDDLDEYGHDKNDFINTTWLYRMHCDFSYVLAIGVDEKGFAMAIDDEGRFGVYTGIFCNIPYALLRTGCFDKVDDFFKQEPEFKQALDIYEKWCQEQNIELDSKHAYHDSNGQLFTDLEFFEK
jgi:hypothetical protein